MEQNNPSQDDNIIQEQNPSQQTNNDNNNNTKIDFFSSQDPDQQNKLERTLSERSAKSTNPVPTVDPKTGSFDYAGVLKDQLSAKEANGIQSRKLGVTFKDLSVYGTDSASSFHQNLGSPFNPSSMKHTISDMRHPKTKTILNNVKGLVKPGEMLLVLGAPGSGCSSLLKVLANQTTDFKSLDGHISYDGISPQQLAKSYKGDAIYCPEDDVHFPTLTVDQTIRFAARCRAPHSRIPNESRDDYTSFMVETLLTLFGLTSVRDTVVGNAAIRGVSGGQKKRVSIAESMALRSCLGAWDNATRGLDSSTALEFIQALRIATDIGDLTSIAALYQASENIYNLFDKVCVLSEGEMVYFGPTKEARQYFIDLGFQPANRQTTPDFLVAATGVNSRIVIPGYEKRIPRTSKDMATAFSSSQSSKRLDREIQDYTTSFDASQPEIFQKSAVAEKAKRMPRSSPYTISIFMQIREVMRRRVQVILGDTLTQSVVLGSFVFQALITGSIFFDLKEVTRDYFSRGGTLFFAILFGTLSAMSEIPALYSQRPIVARHGRAAMYHPFVEAAALTLVDALLFVVVMGSFGIILYFMTHLQRDAGKFFIFFLFIYQTTLTMKSFFRALAASFGTEQPATAFAGVATFIVVHYAGYVIPKPSMIGGLKWLIYLNPVQFSFESMIANEFNGLQGECSTLVPSGPGYENITLANQACTTVGSVPGQAYVDGETYINLSYGYYHKNLWRNYGILWAFTFGFTAWVLIATEIRSSVANSTAKLLFRFRKTPKSSSGSASAASSTTAQNENDDTYKETFKENPSFEDDPEKTVIHSSATSTKDIQGVNANDIKEFKAASQSSVRPTFTFQNINYTIPVGKGETKQLLDDVSGFVVPGKLTALMGESGAGKTTLLNALSERTDIGVISGSRQVNGQVLPNDFKAQTGYCQQMDTHIEFATVKEAVYFSACLRQPKSVPESEKKTYAQHVLKMCALESYQDAIVGTLGVEHSKRLTIAVELAAKPALLLFLDEPTSGLDAQSAIAIVKFMRELASAGQAILCTIHQPSAELFQEFDKLLLLKTGGQTCYFGDLGHNAGKMIEYFEKGGGRKCEPGENPAEWMLDVIGAGATATTDIDWHQVWVNSSNKRELEDDLERIHAAGREKETFKNRFSGEFAMPWFSQVQTLLNRSFKFYWRDPTYIMSKIFLNVVSGLLIGFTFFKAKDSMQGTQNKLFSLFMSLILGVPMAQGLMAPFVRFRDVYEIREGPSGTYSWTALMTSSIIVELPFNFVSSCLFFFCYYWTVGFDNDRAGFTFLMLVVLFPIYYTTVGQATAAFSPDAVVGALLFSVLFSFVIIFNGVMQPYSLLGWWQWMYRFSPFTYMVEAVIGNAVGKNEIRCSNTELSTIQPPDGLTCNDYLGPFMSFAGGYVTNGDSTENCQFCSASSTDAFLGQQFNISYNRRWRDFGIFIGYIVFNIFLIFAFTWLRQGGLRRLFKRK